MHKMKTFIHLSNIDTFIYGCLAIYSLINLRRLDTSIWLFLIFFIPTFAIQLWALILSKAGFSNLYLLPFLITFQCIGLSLFYLHFYKKSKFFIIITPIALSPIIFFLIELEQNYTHMNNKLSWSSHYISSSIFMSLASLALLSKINNTVKDNNTAIHIAILLYFSINSIIFLFGDFLVSIQAEKQIFIWTINILIHLIFLFIIGNTLWKKLN